MNNNEYVVVSKFPAKLINIVDIKENCNYVVYRKATVLKEPMEIYGFIKFAETENYAIYKLVEDI